MLSLVKGDTTYIHLHGWEQAWTIRMKLLQLLTSCSYLFHQTFSHDPIFSYSFESPAKRRVCKGMLSAAACALPPWWNNGLPSGWRLAVNCQRSGIGLFVPCALCCPYSWCPIDDSNSGDSKIDKNPQAGECALKWRVALAELSAVKLIMLPWMQAVGAIWEGGNGSLVQSSLILSAKASSSRGELIQFIWAGKGAA